MDGEREKRRGNEGREIGGINAGREREVEEERGRWE